MKIFSDGTDLERVTNVLDIQYIKLVRLYLKSLTAWPYHYLSQKEPLKVTYYRRILYFIESICLIPGMMYVRKSVGKLSFYELGHNYITVMMNATAVIRLSLTFQEKFFNIIGKFLTQIHLFHHKDRSEFAMQTHINTHKISHFVAVYLSIMTVMGIIMFNVLPLYNTYAAGAFSDANNGTIPYEHSVYFDFPFDYEYNFTGYIIYFFFNWYISFICSASYCGFDYLIFLMVFHLWGHYRILIHDLENFPRPSNSKWYTDEERKMVQINFRDIIIRHINISKFVSELTDVFGLLIFAYYGFHQAACCILLLECSQMDPRSLLRYGPLTLVIFQQLIQLSTVFEYLGGIMIELIDAVYSVPWECMGVGDRKIVLTILRQCQKSESVKVMGMVRVGYSTMVAIIKTSFSYFIMLRTVTTDESQ